VSSKVRLVLALAACLGRATVVQAQTNGRVSSYECCQTMLYPVGARVVALGNALVARSMPDALYVNPAGIAGLELSEFRVHSERSDINKTTTFAVTFGVGRAGTAAISYRFLDYGEIKATDIQGNETGTLSLTDQLLTATFATAIIRHINAGVTYKLFQWRQDCSGFCQEQPASGTTNAVDLGLRLEVPGVPSLQLGFAAMHVGLPLQVKNAAQRDPAPTRLRAGAAYEVLHHFRPDSTMQLYASADVTHGIREGIEQTAAIGLELVLDRSLFVRTGYATGSGKGTGGSVGVGLIWDRFDVSVAKSFASPDGGTEPFQVTFAIAF
jgi:hypothetical protein